MATFGRVTWQSVPELVGSLYPSQLAACGRVSRTWGLECRSPLGSHGPAWGLGPEKTAYDSGVGPRFGYYSFRDYMDKNSDGLELSYKKLLEYERNGHLKLPNLLKNLGMDASDVYTAFENVFNARRLEAYTQKMRVFGVEEAFLSKLTDPEEARFVVPCTTNMSIGFIERAANSA